MTGPLDGVRVVMMGGFGPAPFCGMLLADLGADVVRVDRVGEVDGERPIDALLRRSQRSIALDLKDPAARDVVYALGERADAFVEVYRPGVAERLGVGPDDLLARNPALVYARMTGWGQDGPYARMAGHDINYLALSGALGAIGTADTPVPPLNLLGDYGGGGMLLAVGLLSGILEARRSGEGQVIDVSMFDAAASLMTVFYGMLADGRWEDRRQANVVDGAAHYYRTYETADGKHMAVGALEPRFWAELLERVGLDAGDLPAQLDRDGWPVARERLAAVFRTRTRDQWCALLEGTDACVAPVLSLLEAPAHPHNQARATFVDVGGTPQPAPAPRFSRTPCPTPTPPPTPGEDDDQFLAAWGLAPGRVARLRASGAIRPLGA